MINMQVNNETCLACDRDRKRVRGKEEEIGRRKERER